MKCNHCVNTCPRSAIATLDQLLCKNGLAPQVYRQLLVNLWNKFTSVKKTLIKSRYCWFWTVLGVNLVNLLASSCCAFFVGIFVFITFIIKCIFMKSSPSFDINFHFSTPCKRQKTRFFEVSRRYKTGTLV